MPLALSEGLSSLIRPSVAESNPLGTRPYGLSIILSSRKFGLHCDLAWKLTKGEGRRRRWPAGGRRMRNNRCGGLRRRRRRDDSRLQPFARSTATVHRTATTHTFGSPRDRGARPTHLGVPAGATTLGLTLPTARIRTGVPYFLIHSRFAFFGRVHLELFYYLYAVAYSGEAPAPLAGLQHARGMGGSMKTYSF